LQREHQAVRVDDAGRRRAQRGAAIERRFERAHGLAVQPFEIVDAIGRGLRLHAAQGLVLRGPRGDHQLAQGAMLDAVLAAIGIQGLLAGHAQPRLERAARVVEPGVDHLAVARADAGADGVRRLEHDALAPAARERARHRQADHAGADHHRIDAVHAREASIAGWNSNSRRCSAPLPS
jgi:hypothetical protein